MLPGVDGLEVCKQIQRDRNVPVLMLTVRDSEADLLVGLCVLDVGEVDGGLRARRPSSSSLEGGSVRRPRASPWSRGWA